ncbi:phage tail protein [Leptospira kirschneri]|uniref:phage tail protein n=1 Tax=Leptospira kirschneri TaxID=29507 RepID=UPI0035694DC9
MAWIQLETDKFENGSGWILEKDGMFGWILYHEDIEDEFPDTFIVLADLFNNPGLGVITLDPATNKIPVDKMPPVAINEVFVVSSQGAMLASNTQRGDMVLRTDIPGPAMFILSGDDPTYLPNWIQVTTQFPDWSIIQNKPTSFPPTAHNHDASYYTKTQIDSSLAVKRDSLIPIPATEITLDSTHRFVTDSEKGAWNSPPPADWNSLQNKPASFPPTVHNHDASYYTKTETDLALSQKRNVGNIPATEVSEDSSHRFVTDAQIDTWNSGGSSAGGFDVGDVKTSARNSVPSGWLTMNGQTIGNTGSGANNVGSTFQNLFILLWNDWSNTVLPILSSTGTATTRGTSAVADWNAGKRLPIPNLCGRTAIGAGAATGLTTRNLGESIGEEAHTLTLPETPNHDHGGGNHSHPVDRANFLMQGGGISIKVGYSATSTHSTRASGNIITPQGGGLPHNNMQPSLVLNYFIKY